MSKYTTRKNEKDFNDGDGNFNFIASVPKPKLLTSQASLRQRDGSELIPMEYWHLLIQKQAMGLPASARSICFQATKAAALLKKILKQSGVTKLSKPQAAVQNPKCSRQYPTAGGP